jgi:membrane-bound metal-dependent hydrolase YbcI (DUF457 family)
MADFRTHIAVSSTLGAVYGGAGHALGMPLTSSIIAGGLCALSGMLPDLDSQSGVPFRETISLAAAIAPMLMMDRFTHMGLTHEEIILAAAFVYLAVRFGLGSLFRWYTVHRGMWHSIPAAVIAGLVVYLLCGCQDQPLRIFKALGAVLGFLSHLVLDECYSVQIAVTGIHRKRSFGSALKLWSHSTWANLSTYGKLVLLIGLAFGDVRYFEPYFHEYENKLHTARRAAEEILEKGKNILR